MSKYFWVVLVGVVITLGAVFMLSGGKQNAIDTSEFAYEEPVVSVQSHDHQQGEGTKATIVEYADFQCPGCAGQFPLLEQVKQAYGDEVKVVFRHFPITSTHPQAMAAHRAAEAAGRQDQFWPMHDILFAQQQAWSGQTNASDIFEGYAEQLGLDMDQYRADIESDSVFAKITSDLDSGEVVGVSATPTLFVNGVKLDRPPTSLEEWQSLIDGDSQTEEQQEEN